MDNKQTKHNSIQLFSPQFPALNIITFLNTFLKLTFNFFISSLLFFPSTPPMYSTLLTPELMVSFTGMAVTHAYMLKSQQHDCLNKIWERVVPTDLTWTPTLDTEYVISRLSIRYRIIGVLFLEKTISSTLIIPQSPILLHLELGAHVSMSVGIIFHMLFTQPCCWDFMCVTSLTFPGGEISQ